MKNGGNEIIGRCNKNIYDKILDGPSMLLLREKIAYLHQQEIGNHGWLFVFEPSQSPITNIHDAYFFPVLSQDITTNKE